VLPVVAVHRGATRHLRELARFDELFKIVEAE
jgi:hypothetical protein